MQTTEWERRVADAWASLDERDEVEFRMLMEKLIEELPPGDPDGCSSGPSRWTPPGTPISPCRSTAHLPRYQRSMANYARLLVEPGPAADPETDVRS